MTEEMVWSWQFQLMMFGVYVANVLFLAHAALGLTRTIFVRNPYRIDGDGLPVPLFQGDYTIKLYSRHERVRLCIKLFTLGAGAVLSAISVTYMMYVYTTVGYVWMVGTKSVDDTAVQAGHVLAIGCLLGWGISRGYRGAKVKPDVL